jgi:Holliday junction resolvasome RuvABC endonuclease subunit
VGECEQVAIEGYAYGAQGRVFHIAENTGILKYKLYEASIPLEVVTPSHVKKLASGKGNADKTMMYESFLKETGIKLKDTISPNKKDIGNPVSDIVDAYYICKNLYLKLKP